MLNTYPKSQPTAISLIAPPISSKLFPSYPDGIGIAGVRIIVEKNIIPVLTIEGILFREKTGLKAIIAVSLINTRTYM